VEEENVDTYKGSTSNCVLSITRGV